MARLSAAGAPATPDQTEESEERSSTGAGAMATSNAAINARPRDNASPGIRGMFSNTTHTGAMGQNESREIVRARNNALHRAPGQAVAPKAGKLPRRSGGLSRVASGQRRLGRNVLADANTYDVPSDDEPAPRRRQSVQQQSREERQRQKERERQAALDRQLDLDWERESERVVEDIESRREGSRAGLLGEDAAVHEVSESGFSGIQSHGTAEERSETLMNALYEPVPELPQQNAIRKTPGRPQKSKPEHREPEQACDQPRKRGRHSVAERDADQPRRKRGRPSNAERKAEARRAAAHEAVEELVVRSVLVGMTDELSPTSPPPVARVSAAPNPTAPNRRLQRSLQTAAVEPVPVPSALNIRPRQASIDNVARNGLNSRHRVSASNYGGSLFVHHHDTDQPHIVHPTELGDLNSVEDNDQTAKYTTEFRRWEEQQLNEELEREISAREEERERQVQWRKLELHNQDKWKRMNKARFDVSKNSGDIKKQHHLRSCGMQLVQTDADGQPYLPTNLRGRRGMWTEHESTTLETSLRNNVDTPAPLDSMVFEKIIAEECKFRRPLANKNVLEIVIEANEIKDFWINWRRDTGAPIDGWVQKIPRWMDPPSAQHDNGSSAEDAIEIE